MSITWLHISDFHVRSGDPYDRDVVLGALVRSVAEYRERGRAADLIFATGDIAHAGKVEEYQLANKFFDDLLTAAGLSKERLFVIPGNHDVDRDLGIGLARTLDSREEGDKYFRADRPHPHLTQKLGAYLDWHRRYFGELRATPTNSTCGPVELVRLKGHRLGILPINSALFCLDDDDHGKLWVGRRCLDAALAGLKELKAEVKIALVHHPLEWLHPTEGSNIQAELEASVDVLLRGHLHEARIEAVASPEGEMLRCAAGAAYQSRKWPNRAFYGTFDGGELRLFPIRYEDAPRPIWTTDPSVFPREAGHEKSFRVPSPQPSVVMRSAVAAPAFQSNIESRGHLPFVGRDPLLVRIADELGDPGSDSVVVLHGPPGVGKSELAKEFARRNRDRYPGGRFWVDASTDAVDIGLASIGKNILNVQFPAGLPLADQGMKTFYSLGPAPVLLIYDNVVSFERLKPWLPLSGMPCHVLITTLLETQDFAWACLPVEPLLPEEAQELVLKLTGPEFAAKYGTAITAHAGGLPVQIVPETTTLAYEVRRGRTPAPGAGLAREAGDSFGRAYSRLEPHARLLLHAASILHSQRMPRVELALHMQKGAGWSASDFDRALDTCLDLHLLEGTPDPSMHQLFAAFLRGREASVEERGQLSGIRAAQRARLVEISGAVSDNPADTQSATRLVSYPLTPGFWEDAGNPLPIEDGRTVGCALYEIGLFKEAQAWCERAVAEAETADGMIDHERLGNRMHLVGRCLSSTGQYAEARQWFERAVAEKELGDLSARVNHTSLGMSLHEVGDSLSNLGEDAEALHWFERSVDSTSLGNAEGLIDHACLSRSLHQVGYCLWSMDHYVESRRWFERAVAEAEKGDLLGRVDHENLASSLHQVGYCLCRMGQDAEALPWFERAAVEAQKGDVHGRIDHASLGMTVQLVGDCLWNTGRYGEARPWFERAIAEAAQGDVHGRVDHETLGSSVHQVGYLLSRTGEFAEAQSWFERAIAEKLKGDVHGRIDHESVGVSVHRVGMCLMGMGADAAALPWFERAIAEKEQGDVHGRVDWKSLALSLRAAAGCLKGAGQTAAAEALEKRAGDADAQLP